jgi:hypothetical protein
MHYKQRIESIEYLGHILEDVNSEHWQPCISKTYQENQGFTPTNTVKALSNLGNMLSKDLLSQWLNQYNISDESSNKKIGIIMAGNIPLVGLHDLVSCMIAGHDAVIKMSRDDKVLLPYLLEQLFNKFPYWKEHITLVDKLTTYDAVIATGSNNTSRHFQYYFKHVPHLIRKNRHSVAIIKGDETKSDFELLAEDLFSYFGLGCRNVSKFYVPEPFDYPTFYDSIESFNDIKNHNKYANNHTYNKAINIMNLVKIYDNDFLILYESEQVGSPVAVCHYEFYKNDEDLQSLLQRDAEHIQCVVKSNHNPFEVTIDELKDRTFLFGEAQCPNPWDYADGVDTLQWLIERNQ